MGLVVRSAPLWWALPEMNWVRRVRLAVLGEVGPPRQLLVFDVGAPILKQIGIDLMVVMVVDLDGEDSVGVEVGVEMAL
jgi:hypothetical protein